MKIVQQIHIYMSLHIRTVKRELFFNSVLALKWLILHNYKHSLSFSVI